LANGTLELRTASKLEIVSIVDNTVDFLSSNARKEVQSFRRRTKERYGENWDKTNAELPVAEHGLCILVRIFSGENSCSIIFDTGVSSNGAVLNAKRMGIDLSEVASVVLSHGHYDHFGGLLSVIKAANKIDLPIVVHDDIAERRGTADPKGKIRQHPPFPNLEQLYPAKIVKTHNPLLIADGLACVTGEIPRTTLFEKGLKQNRVYKGNSWQSEQILSDECALVLNVQGKGLVVLSGCAHVGIINTIKYAQQITGITKVYAVLGGFHLAGKEFEGIIKPTVEELEKINPELIVPSHCTGWRALSSIADSFPSAFVFNSVGNIYQF
jgi:7,8-dihydropterin-6-yl-methyl-4-(beta-D-ribofuranosyl)aminobenzene 5'-phosphate synthase